LTVEGRSGLCPMPYALCPMPYALCPMPYAHNTMLILGISAYYHDSAAVLISADQIVAAAHQERFSRRKHDAGFPTDAVRYVLAEAGIGVEDLDAIAFYDKPFLKFERLLETYHAFTPKGLRSFLAAMPVWIREKIFMRKMLWDALDEVAGHTIKRRPQLLFPEHHLSHGASAFYPSPFQKAAILTIDGVGEWATTTIGIGDGADIKLLRETHFPHSLGLLYSAFTYYCGFRVNSGEYKLMGLAPYGNPDAERVATFKRVILEELIDLKADGSYLMNMDYFNYPVGLTMTGNAKWEKLFGVARREPETDLTQPYMDLALAIQQVAEDVVFRLAATARSLTGCDNLVMAGGVALNCVANGKLIRNGTFENVWIQPAAGDAGGALGAAYAALHIWKKAERTVDPDLPDGMQGAYLGPAFNDRDYRAINHKYKAPYRHFADFDRLCEEVTGLITSGKVIGWFQGRMEYGPRALGNRSIIGDPRNPEMQKKLNLKIKYREGFRPFAPSVMEEEIGNAFELDRPSPYMLLVAPVKSERCNPLPENYNDLDMYDRLYHLRSDIPAITHVDYSARIQSVSRDTNPRYWQLINTFRERPASAWWSIPASTCAANPLSAPRKTPTSVSCAPRWTSWSWAITSFSKKNSRTGRSTRTG
jgi:carbamoyltransferase